MQLGVQVVTAAWILPEEGGGVIYFRTPCAQVTQNVRGQGQLGTGHWMTDTHGDCGLSFLLQPFPPGFLHSSCQQ